MDIPFLSPDENESPKTILRNRKKYNLRQVNWLQYPYKPDVCIQAGWNPDTLYILFTVQEKYIRAVETKAQGRVWEDSCVELFLSPDQNEYYYNFEFNCIGTCLLAFGNSRNDRIYAPAEVVSSITTGSSLGKDAFDTKEYTSPWELFVSLPASSLFQHPGRKFRKESLRANFQKCGDKLPERHFLSWNPINTPTPDFHRPEFFGTIRLV